MWPDATESCEYGVVVPMPMLLLENAELVAFAMTNATLVARLVEEAMRKDWSPE